MRVDVDRNVLHIKNVVELLQKWPRTEEVGKEIYFLPMAFKYKDRSVQHSMMLGEPADICNV